MIQQNAVALSYIKNEINHRYECLPQQTKDNLIITCGQFIKGKISFENARLAFISVNNDLSFINKLQRILQIQSEPAPPLEQFGNFPQRRAVNSFTGSRKKSIPWTEIEDLRLIAAIFRFGAKDWRQIAEFVGNDRSSSQCNQRWCRAIDPNINHAPWTAEEDQQLLRAVDVLGNKNWCQVAKIIDRRTDLQCRYRYQQLAKASTTKPAPLVPTNAPQAAKRTNVVKGYQQEALLPRQQSNESLVQQQQPMPQMQPQQQQTQKPFIPKMVQKPLASFPSQKKNVFPLIGISTDTGHAIDSDDALVADFVPKNTSFVPPTLEEISLRRRNSITIAPFVHEQMPYYLDGTKMTPVNKTFAPMLHRVPPRIIQRTPGNTE